jgi:LmbE family N-acetylglucosaminyl deacetylase
MNHLFTPLLPREPLRPPVLVLAAHPDDEVIGAGAMLAWHAARGHDVTIVHVTDGARGDPDHPENDVRALRRREGDSALRYLGLVAARHWDLPDGGLPEHLDALIARLRALFAEVRPATLYSFWFGEAHRDHRAVAAATAAAAAALPADCRCLLYGVNHVVPGGVLFDTTDRFVRKHEALRAYGSQNAYVDLPGLAEHRDRANTANVDIAGVFYCEMFCDLLPAELPLAGERAVALHRMLLRDP